MRFEYFLKNYLLFLVALVFPATFGLSLVVANGVFSFCGAKALGMWAQQLQLVGSRMQA